MDQQAPLQKTLIEELGLSDLPKEKQEQLIIKMTEVILKKIFIETLEKLSDQDKEAYTGMMTANATPEELEEFLRGKINNYDQMMEKIVADFRREMISN